MRFFIQYKKQYMGVTELYSRNNKHICSLPPSNSYFYFKIFTLCIDTLTHLIKDI